MRMSDTLKTVAGWADRHEFRRYAVSRDLLAGLAGDGWDLLFDTQQVTTQRAGKSGCVFFFKTLFDFNEAAGLLALIHRSFPKVNLELHVIPDGHSDFGDGGGSYRFAPLASYFPPSGLCYGLLVDAQNLLRYGAEAAPTAGARAPLN